MLTAAVEGVLDEAVLRRLIDFVGLEIGPVYGRKGKQQLLESLRGYNAAARVHPWVVLVDLDLEYQCASEAVEAWLPIPSQYMRLRAVVRSIESWILADGERLADFLGIARRLVPENPDSLAHPKRELLLLAQRSRKRILRNDLVPRAGSGRNVGPLYNPTLARFVGDIGNGWRPEVARMRSQSLDKCIGRISELI